MNRLTVQLTMLLAAALMAPALNAQPVPGNSEPRELRLGVLREGGALEGRMRVWLSGTRLAGRTATADAPSWMRITRISVESQYFGRRTGSRLYCEVDFSVDARAAGQFNSTLRITSGAQRIDVPVTLEVRPAEAASRRVLIMTSPFDPEHTEDFAQLERWFTVLREHSLDVTYLRCDGESDVLRGLDLGHFHVLLLADDAVVQLTDADIGKLNRFVNGGGRLVLAAQALKRGSIDRAQAIVRPLGLELKDLEPTGARLVVCEGSSLAGHPLMHGVQSVKLMRPSPITVTDAHSARLLVQAEDGQQGWVASARLGRGEIIVLTQSQWWLWLSDEQYDESDNIRLLRNVLLEPIVLPPGT